MSEWEPAKPEPKPVAVQTYFGDAWHIKRTPWSEQTACLLRIPYYQTARRWPPTIDPTARCTQAACLAVFEHIDREEETSIPR